MKDRIALKKTNIRVNTIEKLDFGNSIIARLTNKGNLYKVPNFEYDIIFKILHGVNTIFKYINMTKSPNF